MGSPLGRLQRFTFAPPTWGAEVIGDIKSALSLKSADRKRLNSNLRSLAQQPTDFWQHIGVPLARSHSALNNLLIGNHEPKRHARIRPE